MKKGVVLTSYCYLKKNELKKISSFWFWFSSEQNTVEKFSSFRFRSINRFKALFYEVFLYSMKEV